MTKKFKTIISLDFDGVLHSYSSGWKGPRNIPDPPVIGAIAFLMSLTEQDDIEVNIFSSRARYFGGIRAMKKWLRKFYELEIMANDLIDMPYYEEMKDDIKYDSYCFIKKLKFPKKKPPSHILIDDRAMQFTGTFPRIADLKNFRPWNE